MTFTLTVTYARFCTFLVLGVLSSFGSLGSAQGTETYRIVHAYPHDQQAFTQGLVYVDGHLYESTGRNGHSSLREEDLETGRILQLHDVPDKYFGEGLTDWKNTLIQLTWQSHVALVYDGSTFHLLRTFCIRGRVGV